MTGKAEKGGSPVPDRRLHGFLINFTDIRPDEARQALGFFFYFFLITLSIYIIKPVKESFLIGPGGPMRIL
jgi:ATP/ADP translocase